MFSSKIYSKIFLEYYDGLHIVSLQFVHFCSHKLAIFYKFNCFLKLASFSSSKMVCNLKENISRNKKLDNVEFATLNFAYIILFPMS